MNILIQDLKSIMKNKHLITLSITICIFLFIPYSLTGESTGILEKYNLPFWASIYNNYQPGRGNGHRESICAITFDSKTKLPPMEVSAWIITDTTALSVTFYDRYNGEQNEDDKPPFHYYFAPTTSFRLEDGEIYRFEITITVNGEQQTFIFENQIVGVTS